MIKRRRHKWKSPIVTVLLAIAVGLAVTAGRPGPRGGNQLKGKVVKIKEEMKPLETVGGDEYPASIKIYFDYYGLDPERRIPDVEHLFGTFTSGKRTLAAHIYRPKEYKATVILLHGYLNHTGEMKHLIAHLLANNYAAAVYDMPGHGLSDGERAAIDDFSEYTRSLVDFTRIVSKLTKGPRHVVGFSTGGTVVVDYLLSQKGVFFDKVILAAPLIRNLAWQSSKTGYKLYSNFSDNIPRAIRKNSSDKEFLKFNRHKDVLHAQNVSLKWVKALHEWNDEIADAETSDKPVRIIQGSKDTTVSYKYNLSFIRDKFDDVQVTMIDGGRHELFNEGKELRDKVMASVINYLRQ